MSATGALRRHVLIGWLLACLVLGLTGLRAIATLDFGDPDDAMRLLQVRDWLAGQSWWDVGQHRMGLPGEPFAMHWSRLVDLPIAAVLLVTDPIFSRGVADRFALVLVPLATLLCAMALAAGITRRLAGEEAGRWAVLLVPLSPPLLLQMRPVRIDHHGWQVVLALAAGAALLRARGARDGALAGLALAALVTVSLEGLPVAAVLAGVATLSAAWTGRNGRSVAAMAAMLFGGTLLLHVATRGPFALAAACDAVSPAWLAALGAAVPGTAVAALAGRRTVRLAGAAAAGGGALAAMLWLAPSCLAGPFATLDPLVRVGWYEKVIEGLPVWDQPIGWALASTAMPLVGIVGVTIFLGARRRGSAQGAADALTSLLGAQTRTPTPDPSLEREGQEEWLLLLGWLVPLTLYACLVNRAAATANAFAVPGAAALLTVLLARARQVRGGPARLAATAGALLVAAPGAVLGAVTGPNAPPPTRAATAGRAVCDRFGQVRAVAALPPAIVMAPIDLSPELLVATTRHRAVAGGYHRNADAIGTVIRAYAASPMRAEQAIRASGARYLVGCPGLNETRFYAAAAPNGLWARLERGERFDWLVPVRVEAPLLAWRVLPHPRPRP